MQLLHCLHASGLASLARHRHFCKPALALYAERFAARKRALPAILALAGRTRRQPGRVRTDESTTGVPSTKVKPVDPFQELGLEARITARLTEQGVTSPTDVQCQAIPAILSGANTALQCYTGSGKTLAYLLPLLHLAVQRAEKEIEEAERPEDVGQLQAMVVAPSRELAMQIMRVAQGLLPPGAERAVQQAIGGANIARQIENIRMSRPLVVVGTPGRMTELSAKGVLLTHHVPLLVLDEVDQLLAPHFRDEMLRLMAHTGRKLPGGSQVVLVSATLTDKVVQMCSAWCPNPTKIFVGGGDLQGQGSVTLAKGGVKPAWGWGNGGDTVVAGSAGGVGTSSYALSLPPNLRHVFVISSARHRVDALRRTMHALGTQKALIFMNYYHRLKDTKFKLEARGMPVATLHGDMSKQERQRQLDGFRKGEFRALIVSDVVARGLDIPDIDAVFHLEMPSGPAHYAHRSGRTGRMGRAGVVVSLVEEREQYVVEKLARHLGINIEEVKVSHGEVKEVDSDDEDEQGKSGQAQSKTEAGKAAASAGSSEKSRKAAPKIFRVKQSA